MTVTTGCVTGTSIYNLGIDFTMLQALAPYYLPSFLALSRASDNQPHNLSVYFNFQLSVANVATVYIILDKF